MKNKLGQVTIFIIIAIVVVALIVLFFILRGDIDISDITSGREVAPKPFLETCLEDKIQEGIKLISEQGGNIEPVLYKKFMFEEEGYYTNISYLCYNQNYYLPCINQEPMLMNHIEDEIKNYVSADVRTCFSDLVDSLENQGYQVNQRYGGFEVELKEKKVSVNIDADLTLTKTEETSRQEGFEINFPSRVYEVVFVVQEIVNQEARFCNFEYMGYMFYYPEYTITKTKTDDTTIYTVEHEDVSNKFKFAIRSCVFPPGL